MANRRPQGNAGGRRMEFNRNDGRKNFGRAGVSPWQGGGPGASLPNLLPLGGGSTEATLALASNILNLLQPRQNPVPSLLDMPIRRDFVPNMGRFDRNFGPQRMGNQGNFRRTGNYNRAGERINNNRKPFKPNDGQRQQNKSSQKKEADSKAKPVKESESDEKKIEESAETDSKEDVKKEKEALKTRYDDIHHSLLKCHICNKTMWDGRSFENHLSGRAHAIMMTKTAESYALTADTMRQEFKINEMKRTRKSGQQPPRDFYCAMCDMYAADGGVHRTTVGHRKLKKYLHPTCTSCHKEMPTRIELDEHRLTAEHLKNMQEKQDDFTKPKPEVMVISTYSMEQSFLRDGRTRKSRRGNRTADSANDALDNAEPQDDGIKKEPVDGEETDEQKSAKKPIDKENTILDYKEGDDLSHVTSEMLPVYSMERGVGASFLTEFKCIQCKLCNKLLDTAQTAEVHLKTWRHHLLFVRSLQPAQQQEGATKRGHGSSDDGNWKRRRANTDGDDDDENGHDDVNVKSEPRSEEGPDADADAHAAEADADADAGMPPQDELEDWEQSVDEILQDERNDENTDVAEEPAQQEPSAPPAEPEPVPEPQPEPVPEPEVKPTPAPVEDKQRSSPRRGRGRGRGRY